MVTLSPVSMHAKTTPAIDGKFVLRPTNIITNEDEDDRAKGIVFGHSTMRDAKLTKDTAEKLSAQGSTFLHKQDDVPDRRPSEVTVNPLQVEVACTNFFNLLDPEHCARAFIVVNQNNIASRCLIERIEGLRTIDQVLLTEELPVTTPQLIEMGITPVFIYNFLLQNNDFRTGNIGLTPDNKLIAFDFDQALWSYPTCALYDAAYDTRHKKWNADLFPLSLRDIQNFPAIQDARPNQWPSRDVENPNSNYLNERAQKLADSLSALKDNAHFVEEKYYC